MKKIRAWRVARGGGRKKEEEIPRRGRRGIKNARSRLVVVGELFFSVFLRTARDLSITSESNFECIRGFVTTRYYVAANHYLENLPSSMISTGMMEWHLKWTENY